jgi:hypothetical protein
VTTTTFATADAEDAGPTLEELEYQGRRLAEELATLQHYDAHHADNAATKTAEVVQLAKALAALPATASASTVAEAKRALTDAEYQRDRALEEKANLQDELLEVPLRIRANAKAIAAAKAEQ